MGRVKILGKEVNYRPYMDGMYMDKIQIRLMNDKTFIRIFQKNLTDKMYSVFKDTVNPTIVHEDNMVLSVSGMSGSGKSATLISLIHNVIPERFTAENVCFFDSQILKLAKIVPRDTFIVRDEGIDKATFGVGSQRTSRQLQVLTETCRKAGLSLVFIEPEFRENQMAKYYLEVVDRDIENRITRLAVKDPYTKQYLGAMYVPVLPEQHPILIEYNRKKDRFIQDMRSGRLSESKEDYKSLAREMAEKIDLDIFAKKKERLMFIRSELPNLTNSETDMVATFMEVIIKHGTEALIGEQKEEYDDEEEEPDEEEKE